MAIEMLPPVVGRISGRTFLWALIPLCGACQADPDGFSEQDRELIRLMVLAPEPEPETPAAYLGRALFFDPTLSGTLVPGAETGQPKLLAEADGGATGRVSCADCHTPQGFFGDDRTAPNNVSLGLDFTSRNSPSLVNVSLYRWFAWDGRSDSLFMQCATAYEAKRTMSGKRLRLARIVANRYADAYADSFGDGGFSRLARTPGADNEFDLADGGEQPLLNSNAYLNGIAANCYKALAAYISQLVSLDAGIDAFARGDEAALSPAAKRGLRLFLGRAGCVECHQGSSFTDNSFHSVGVGQRGLHVLPVDDGRVSGAANLVTGDQSVFNSVGPFAVGPPAFDPQHPPTESSTPGFRTKSLRNVARSPPYMHAGQLQSLADVVRFYNAGGESTGFSGTKDPRIVPLGLTDAESADLVAFLESLSGQPVPEKWSCDPSPRDAGYASAQRVRGCPP